MPKFLSLGENKVIKIFAQTNFFIIYLLWFKFFAFIFFNQFKIIVKLA